jgi:hypothetical protein
LYKDKKAITVLYNTRVKKSNSDNNQLLKKIKNAVAELNYIKAGSLKAKNFNDLLSKLK